MKKKKIILLFFFIIIFLIAVNAIPADPQSKISKTQIVIGEKILLQIKIPKLKKAAVLWEAMTINIPQAEIYSKQSYYKDNNLILDIIFTFFESGNYDNFMITVPINLIDGSIIIITSSQYNIIVNNYLTPEEKSLIQKIKDPAKIELKKEKTQAALPFHVSKIIVIILLLMLLVIMSAITYFVLYKKIFKTALNGEQQQLSPYHQFLADLEQIHFDLKDSRLLVETKLSQLSEIIKELINRYFSLNAPSETTHELISSLRKINFKHELVNELDRLFSEIDMIKFAKAPYDYDNLKNYLEMTRQMGNEIHNFKQLLTTSEENREEDIKIT